MPNPVIEHIEKNNVTYDVKDIYAERSANKVTSFPNDDASLSDEHYPSEKLVKTAINSLKSELEDEMSHIDLSGKEDVANKTTSFSVTPSDTKYPTEKLVKDGLDLKEDAANKVIAFPQDDQSLSDTNYPSEKLVKTALNALQSALEDEIDNIDVSSTEVVSQLPSVAEADPDVDYVLYSGGTALYYKLINGSFVMVGGATAYVNNSLPVSGDEHTDYYILNANGVYIHYRWKNGVPSGEFYEIGTDSYTKSQIDTMFSADRARISAVEDDLAGMGTMVSEISANSASGIDVTFTDSTSRTVNTVDGSRLINELAIISDTEGSVLRVTYRENVGGTMTETTDDLALPAGGGGGSATTGSATITRVTDATITSILGETTNISYLFEATDASGDVVGSGSATWYVNSIPVATSIALQGATNTFDIGPYLSVGSNQVKLSITVDTGGESPLVRTKPWTVNAVNMYVEWDYDDTTINEEDYFTLRFTPYGTDIEKTTHIIVDGTQVATNVTRRSGAQQAVTLEKLSHGSHLVMLYCTATVNGTNITSDTVTHDMIFVDSESDVPVISCSVQSATISQYNTLAIPIAIYTPNSMTSDAVLKVDNVTVAEWTGIDRTLHSWNYTPSDYGSKTLTITSGVTTKTLHITVTQLDIDNEEIGGYTFKLKASELAGNSALQNWNSNGVTLTFSENFDWDNGGIQTETDENLNVRQFICVKAGTTMTINHELFANDAKANGKNFKVIFKPINSRDYDAVFLSCISDNVGVQFGANGGIVRSEQNSMTVQYKEDSYTEIDYDIYPLSKQHYMQLYVDGVLAGTKIYPDGDNFTQANPEKIVIGSQDCDVYIYMVKAYDSYLTMDNHIENFIADAPNASEMLARYERNDILNDGGEISYTKLAEKNPNCRVHLWNVPRMPRDKIKKDPVSGCSYQQIYTAGDRRHAISATGVTIGIQGTSSINYRDSGMNTDARFENGFTDGNGNHIDTYSMTDDSIGVSFFNTKVNIASCENINNMCLAEWYNRFQPYKSGARLANPKARDCMEHHIGVQFVKDASGELFNETENYHMYAICNMGNSKDNSAVFHDVENPLECCFETKDNDSNICMFLDPITLADLDSENYFEFRYPTDKTKRTAEMKTAFINFANWLNSLNPLAATNAPLPSPVTYGAYTFRGTGQENEVLAGLTIDTYAGTYTTDTREYRMAKLLDECEDHMIMDSIVYHYVFIEEHAMVDNVTKNTFWGTDDLVHWHLCKNYDNDTADGNDNNGELIVPFGSEGMDMMSPTRAVFNGKDNVYWQFIFGLYEARQLMWRNRENAGAWQVHTVGNAEGYLDFAKEVQNYIPERVYNQDYWYKYLRLYETEDNDDYITKLEGGKKNHQREAFVENNFWYMASQYLGSACSSDSITMRGYTPKVDPSMDEATRAEIEATIAAVPPRTEVSIMLYNKGYINVQVAEKYERVKAEKGVYYTVSFAGTQMNDTVFNIHGARNVRAIGDISCLYVGRSNFSNAVRLRSLQVGNPTAGYKNSNLTNIGFGNNKMLEYLYIQNCPRVEMTLDLSNCQAIRELDIRGSGFTGITFALGGLLENALLNSPSALEMRGLYKLDDEHLQLESYDNLRTLRFESTPNVEPLLIVESAVNLNRVRIMDVDWGVSETDILNRLLAMAGVDERGLNIPTSVLTGSVYVSGSIRVSEIDAYASQWPDLEVTYESEHVIQQYLGTYVNADGSTLYSYLIDRGDHPIDPVAEGFIPIPTRESSAQYNYTFSGWEDLQRVVYSNVTINALYSTTVRDYTVRWFANRTDTLPKQTATVQYGREAVYTGERPVNTSAEANLVFNLFKGWDKNTGSVKGDMDVYAQWDTRSGLPTAGTELTDMSCIDIYSVLAARRATDYFTPKDYFDITFGYDPTFENVQEEVLLTNRYFDGTGVYDTGISLFDANAPSFTLAIDFEFISGNINGSTLVSCCSGTSNLNDGFRMYYGQTNISVSWMSAQSPAVAGYATNRNLVVLRHIKGAENLHVYTFNVNQDFYSDAITVYEIPGGLVPTTTGHLMFGGVIQSATGGYAHLAKGWIHWSKIWYDDLGASEARKIVAWPHEKFRIDYTGADRFTPANGSFMTRNLFPLKTLIHNTTDHTGWSGSKFREVFCGRIFDAFPEVWKSAIKTVSFPAISSSVDGNVTYVTDKIFMPTLYDIGSRTTHEIYSQEGWGMDGPIAFFDDNLSRVKYPLVTDDREEGESGKQYIVSSYDPTTLESYTISEGDIWKYSGGDYYYVFLSGDTVAKHTRIGVENVQSGTRSIGQTVYPATKGDGVWLLGRVWWLRTPSVGASNNMDYYWAVSEGGNPYQILPAYNDAYFTVSFCV